MARRNYRKKTYRRKKRRPRRSKNNTVATYKTNSPLGKKFKTMLRYSESSITLDATTGLLADQVFRANGLFDPNVTGVGHQPYGYDQIAPMYDHWTVIAARMRVTFTSFDQSTCMVAGISVKDTDTALTDKESTIEQGNTKWVTLGTKAGPHSTQTITYDLNPNKFLGISHPLSSSLVRGTVGVDPVEGCYFHIWTGSGPTDDPGIVSAVCTIEYTVVFTEPKNLGSS